MIHRKLDVSLDRPIECRKSNLHFASTTFTIFKLNALKLKSKNECNL